MNERVRNQMRSVESAASRCCVVGGGDGSILARDAAKRNDGAGLITAVIVKGVTVATCAFVSFADGVS